MAHLHDGHAAGMPIQQFLANALQHRQRQSARAGVEIVNAFDATFGNCGSTHDRGSLSKNRRWLNNRRWAAESRFYAQALRIAEEAVHLSARLSVLTRNGTSRTTNHSAGELAPRDRFEFRKVRIGDGNDEQRQY